VRGIERETKKSPVDSSTRGGLKVTEGNGGIPPHRTRKKKC